MVQVYSILQRGERASTHCGDYQFYAQVEDWHIAAVMDGCASGVAAHFAATLYAKCLKKVVKGLPYIDLQRPGWALETLYIEQLGLFLLEAIFEDIRATQQVLALEEEDLLSTFSLLIYQSSTGRAWINISGDGVVIQPPNVFECIQQAQPDYMAYHLQKEFSTWYAAHSQTFEFEDVEDISISTDGILDFQHPHYVEPPALNLIKYLGMDTQYGHQSSMLVKKCYQLAEKYQWAPNDDLSMIRLRRLWT